MCRASSHANYLLSCCRSWIPVREFDTDKSGFIDREELKAVLAALNPDLTKKDPCCSGENRV